MSSNTTSDASIGRLSHLERTVQSLPLSTHHDNEPFHNVLWPCIQQCIPIERISKLFPPLHEMNQMRLYHRLFEELERFNYNPDVLKDLRSRGRERFTLRGLFTYIHIDYSEVMSHFQTNPQDREDLEAYILASGLVMNRIRRPDTWSNVYPTTNAIKTRWEEFANESLSSLIDLVHFSNIMNYALKYISAIGNQQRLLTICACLAEGPRHARYVTGSAQSSRTSNRVLIYRTLSNTTKIARPKRKGQILYVHLFLQVIYFQKRILRVKVALLAVRSGLSLVRYSFQPPYIPQITLCFRRLLPYQRHSTAHFQSFCQHFDHILISIFQCQLWSQ